MIADLKPYPDYKVFQASWLREIPAHWQTMPGFAAFRENQIKNVGMTDLRVGLVRNRGIITSAYICLQTTDRVVPEYGYQLLHALDLTKIFYGLGSGLRQNLSFLDFKRLQLFMPPPDEQTSIIRFLDHADQRIQRYIRAKQKLIKLLEEQKQAIIHRAVTRGLDPNVRLKPSGVEWLGMCRSIGRFDATAACLFKGTRRDSQVYRSLRYLCGRACASGILRARGGSR